MWLSNLGPMAVIIKVPKEATEVFIQPVNSS